MYDYFHIFYIVFISSSIWLYYISFHVKDSKYRKRQQLFAFELKSMPIYMHTCIWHVLFNLFYKYIGDTKSYFEWFIYIYINNIFCMCRTCYILKWFTLLLQQFIWKKKSVSSKLFVVTILLAISLCPLHMHIQ